eukprot:g15200.t1
MSSSIRNSANDEQADGRQQSPMKTPSLSGPAQPFSEVGRCLLSATISNAGEAGNAAVISHFQPLIRSNKEENDTVKEHESLVQEIREEYELFLHIANTSLLKAKLSQQRKQNKMLIEKLQQNRKKTYQKMLQSLYHSLKPRIENFNGKGDSAAPSLPSKETSTPSISKVGVHAIKTHLKSILPKGINKVNDVHRTRNTKGNRTVPSRACVEGMTDDSDNESTASTTSTMTAMTDDTSSSAENNLTMHETLLLRMHKACTSK